MRNGLRKGYMCSTAHTLQFRGYICDNQYSNRAIDIIVLGCLSRTDAAWLSMHFLLAATSQYQLRYANSFMID